MTAPGENAKGLVTTLPGKAARTKNAGTEKNREN